MLGSHMEEQLRAANLHNRSVSALRDDRTPLSNFLLVQRFISLELSRYRRLSGID